jgi:hypothetical protein
MDEKIEIPRWLCYRSETMWNVKAGKIHVLKSHDYHIIKERLLHVMLRGYREDDIWEALAELSYFYGKLCAKEIKKDMMEKLETEIPVLICKLEKIFPAGWFNPMQHLLVRIPYEAKVSGPVQYRWMYHIERALKYLRSMVSNKVGVEGCIAESFLLKEITYFWSLYFAEEYNVNALTLRYNVNSEPPLSDLKIFQWRGTTASSSMTYYYTQEEQTSALLYMYSNMEEMDPFFM